MSASGLPPPITSGEERMRIPRAGPELGMELARHEERVLRDLDDLDQLLLGPDPRDVQAVLLQRLEVIVVDLVAVAVALADDPLAVEPRGSAALGEQNRVEAEAHGAALVGQVPLLGKEIDHEVRGAGHELRGVRRFQPARVARELDDRALHAEADPEVRHALLARVAHGLDLALDAAVPEAARHQDAVDVGEVGGGPVTLDVLRVDPRDVDFRLVRDPAVRECLHQALVGVLEVDVLADHRQPRGRRRRLHALHDVFPAAKVDGPVLEAERLHDDLVQTFPVKDQRDLVDGVHVLGGDDRLFVHVAEERDLRLDPGGQIPIGAAEEDVGLDPDGPQLLHRVLGRLGLELRGRLDEGHQREVHVEHVVLADVLLHLADGLQEGQALDVADGTAHLDDDHVEAGRHLADHGLDLVGDVRDHLHRASQIIATALLGDDRVIDLAGGDVVVARHAAGGEPLVVAEVEVGLTAIVGDEHLAVLVGTHRPRVDVDVGIHLLQAHPVAPRLEQRAHRRRRQPLAQRGDHTARHEDVFRRQIIPSFRREASMLEHSGFPPVGRRNVRPGGRPAARSAPH